MARKSKGNYQGPKEERIPREKEEKEPEIITALKNEVFLKFLKNSRYSYLSDSKDLDLNKWDENLQSNIVSLYKAWDLARYKPKKDDSKDKPKDKPKEEGPSLARQVQEFYNKIISEEIGMQLSKEDLKSIEKRLLQEVIDVSNSAPEDAESFAAAMSFVANDLNNFEKFERLPAEIRKKRAEIISQTVADKKTKKEKMENISAEKQELLHQLEIRKKNLKTRIENDGWTNAKNFPLLGRLFWDNEDKYIMKKSVDDWQDEVENYLNRIRKARETENEIIEETSEKIDQSVFEMKKELAEFQKQVKNKKSQITTAKWKSAVKVLFFGILGLSSRHKKIKEKEKSLEELEAGVKKYEEMIAQAEKKRAELPPEGTKTGKEEEFENINKEYEGLKQQFFKDFFLCEDVYELISARIIEELMNFKDKNNNNGLDQAEAKYEELVNKETGKIKIEYFAGIKRQYVKFLDQAISARFYADCRDIMEKFAFNKDSNKDKLKEVLKKYFEKIKLGSKDREFVRQEFCQALVVTLLKCENDMKRFELKTLALQLGINLEETLNQAIADAKDENTRKRLVEVAEKLKKTEKEPVLKNLNPESAAIIERVKTKNKEFLEGLVPIVSFDQLIKYIQASPLPVFTFDLAVYSKKYLIEIITEAKKTKKLDKFNTAPKELVAKLRELIFGETAPEIEAKPESPTPSEKNVEEETIIEETTEPEAPVQIELQEFLDKVASVVTLVELIKTIKDSTITVFNFKEKPFTKDDLAFSIITIKNEREKELQLAKVDKIPKELQAKVRELITGKVAPIVETKPEPAAAKQEQIPDDIEEIIPEKPQLELTEPQIKELQEITPEPAKPEEKPAPEKKKAKPAEPEITAPEEKKPEPPKYEILEAEDPAVALVDKIKAIRNSDNEISAKLLVLEAGELLKKYLAGLKGDRKINNNLYKELSKNLKKELGKIKSSNPQQMAVDVENIFNSIRSQAEAKPKEAKPTLKNEPETTIEEPVESETALSQEEQTQEIIEGISSSQEVEEIIEYLKTVPKVVDAEGREMSGQDMALKITRAVMNAGEINNMTEEELPTSYGLRDKIIELLGL